MDDDGGLMYWAQLGQFEEEENNGHEHEYHWTSGSTGESATPDRGGCEGQE